MTRLALYDTTHIERGIPQCYPTCGDAGDGLDQWMLILDALDQQQLYSHTLPTVLPEPSLRTWLWEPGCHFLEAGQDLGWA